MVDLGFYTVQEGYVKLYNGTRLDEVVQFYNKDGFGYAKLWSDEKIPSNIPPDSALDVVKIYETSAISLYNAGFTTYKIHNNEETFLDPPAVPIPSSVLLLGTGFLGLFAWRRSGRG